MKHHPFALPALVAALCCAALPAQAAPAAGQVMQLTGFVLAARPAGGLKLLATQSMVEQGATLSTEAATWLRIALAGGGELLLGPDTRLRLQENKLVLLQGQMRVTAVAGAPLNLEAGENRVTATAASFDMTFVPDTAAAVAQRAYARAATAAVAGPVTDIPVPTQLWQVAQTAPPTLAPPSGARAPGLYVQVIDGAIRVQNPAGSTQFAAGQFGYTSTPMQAPAPLPRNPGLPFTPPPAFTQTSGSSQGSSGPGKSTAVDCVVR